MTLVILSPLSDLPHTRLRYHRTWETGLETKIRVAYFSPAFFCPPTPAPSNSAPFKTNSEFSAVFFSALRGSSLSARTRRNHNPTHPDHPRYPPLQSPHRIES